MRLDIDKPYHARRIFSDLYGNYGKTGEKQLATVDNYGCHAQTRKKHVAISWLGYGLEVVIRSYTVANQNQGTLAWKSKDKMEKNGGD